MENVATDANNLGALTSRSGAPVVDLSPSAGTKFNNFGTIEARTFDSIAILGSGGGDQLLLGRGFSAAPAAAPFAAAAVPGNAFSSAVTGIINAGAGTDVLEWNAGTLVGSIEMDAGDNERLDIVGRDLSTVYHLDGGTGVGDTLNFSNIQYYGGSFAADDAFQNRVHGINLGQEWETINLVNGTDFTLTGDLLYGDRLNLDDTSVLHVGNNVNARLGLTSSVYDNQGVLDLTNGAYSLTDTSTVSGDYVGAEGSQLWLNTHLARDNSPTDKLIVNGGSAGTTSIKINVDPGSPGALTLNGIKVVQVDNDASSNAVFTLQGDYEFHGDPAVVGGAFAYRLYKNGITAPTDGDWYLRSTLTNPDPANPGLPVDPLYQPGVPLYEAYGQALLGFNSLPNMQQRVGNRYWNQPPQTVFCKDPTQNFQCTITPDQASHYADGSTVNGQKGIWGRIELGHSSYEPESSTSGATYDQNLWKLQAGIDGQLTESDAGQLIGGFTALVGTSSSDVSSFFGEGSIDTTGYGLGATLTWYGTNGFYLDGQGSVTWYDSDLNSGWAGKLVDGNNGVGYALSIETGKRFQLDDSWTLTPQVQLAYSSVSFDGFDDRFVARVSSDSADSLRGLLGFAIEYQTSWANEAGNTRHASIYGIGNLYYEFLDDSTPVDVAGTKFIGDYDRLWGEVGLGTTVELSDRTSLYGEARYATSLENFGDSNTFRGNIGFRLDW